ncbi:MAG TPA: protein kinase [Pyrinomonadaceae bacterium]|nr:protein kinase [Pyrinomonadaceae bacterium]
MTPQKWKKVKSVFSQILNLPSEQRPDFLDRVCADDAELKHEVEHLLVSYNENDPFLENSAIEEIADIIFEQKKDTNDFFAAAEKPFFEPGVVLNARYEIIRQLGKGGMGEVYLANDLKINRNVSLKVLQSDVASNKERLRRFHQEAKAISALNHPHIMTIFEFDKTADEIQFIVGEFIDGKTLNDYRNREKLGISEVLEIAIQAASALSAAHDAGIVHRDIKPENIMVRPDGYIKVLDFGLAKLIQPKSFRISDSEEMTREFNSTHPGAIMGTAAYMSPEQARGTKIDIRTDLWSLGVVIYETLTGKKPFSGETSTDIMAAVLREEPRSLSSHLENVPAELEWIVSKSLEKKPESRYQTASELRADLEKIKKIIEYDADSRRLSNKSLQNVEDNPNDKTLPTDNAGGATLGAAPKLTENNGNHTENGNNSTFSHSVEYVFKQARSHKFGAAVAALLLVSLLFYTAYRFFFAQTDHGKIDSIAVLPFENQSQDKQLVYLSDGVSENLINQLSRLPQLKVISKNSSFKFRESTEDLQAIASKLGVRAIVTGSTSQIGDDLVIKFEVVDTFENKHLSGGQYVRKAKDLLKIENEIPQAISEQLNLKLTDSQVKRIATNGTDNPEAFRYYLNGLVELNGPQNILGQSLEYFQKAVELDPNFADAYIQIASIYWQRANASGNPKQLMPKVKEATEKALAIDPNVANVHVMLAALKEYEFDWQSAEQEYRRALELNPNLDFARNNYAFFLSVLGRHDEALAELEQFKERDPINIRQYLTTKGIILAWARKFDESLREFQKIQAADPTGSVEDFSLGYVYDGKGLHPEAAQHFKKAVELVGGDDEYSIALVFLAASYAKIPEKQTEARLILTRLEAMKTYVSPATIAILYTALDDKDKAFQSLEKAYLEGDLQLRFIGVGYEYDGLREDPRFADLTRRIGLQP